MKSDKQRITAPAVPSGDLDSLTKGNNEFAFSLFKKVKDSTENVLFSPHSISTAFAMTYAGARGATETQIASTMHFVLPQQQLHPAFNALDLELAKRGKGAQGKDGKAFRLKIINATWGQRGFSFLMPFLDTLAMNYGAGLRLVDFADAPEKSRTVINDWVAKETEQRVKELIKKGDITVLTRLVLTNAAFFSAAWEEAFDKAKTTQAPFTLLDGSTKQAAMMSHGGALQLRYMKGSGFQAVEMPYDGGELSMLLLLPDAGQFNAFEQKLDEGVLRGVVSQLAKVSVVLQMPRFKFESRLDELKQNLIDLGMVDAMDPDRADFSGIAGGPGSNPGLYVKEVRHKAFIDLDEEGTEASAATAVIINTKSMSTTVTLDRPFVFLIRDHQTNAILFLGHVVDPTA